MDTLLLAIGAMLVFSLCVQMSEGATYSVVPFVNKRALGSVAGIVGAGGNAGAVAAGFLFRSPNLSWPTAFLILGGVVTGVSALSLVVRFAPENVEEGSRVRSDDEDARERVRGWIPETVPAQEVG
jgi:NNP family nitrate/nitrite transporter-like MFS transporter